MVMSLELGLEGQARSMEGPGRGRQGPPLQEH